MAVRCARHMADQPSLSALSFVDDDLVETAWAPLPTARPFGCYRLCRAVPDQVFACAASARIASAISSFTADWLSLRKK